MLYPKNGQTSLSGELFKNPTSEYRGAPFWAWNCKLTKEKIFNQINMMKTMGMGGYHVHVRTGMATDYLSDEFMDFVEYALETGRERQMLTWLYDEDRWPSGTAGGKVTKANPDFAAHYLTFSPTPHDPNVIPGAGISSVPMVQKEAEHVGRYDVKLDGEGNLESYRLLKEGEEPKGDIWYAWVCKAAPDPWFNNQPYVDTLNPKAIEVFAKITHDRYAQSFKKDFGGAIPAIFTDEPNFTRKSTLGFAHEKKPVFLPWTPGIAEKFEERYGQSLLKSLPELFWNLPEGKISTVRYYFHDHVAEMFTSAFCDTLGKWCEENGIMLTGHVLAEPTLASQTGSISEAMRCYRSFQLPGIDMLCDRHEYNTAKQTQSAARQQGAPGVMSELYGVTGWDYEFRGHKLQGDWQAALGVTVRVPHLTWMSMKGEAKRDYPACIGYQSPWYDQYALVEDHFARVNTAMARGKAGVKVAVIHPIESYWLHWGPSEQTEAIRSQMEEHFASLTETLLFGAVDFDFICESRLPQLCEKGGSPLKVGEMSYDAVIVPACQTLRKTTLERLNSFRSEGGSLIFLGQCPSLVDAVPSKEVLPLYEKSQQVSFDAASVLSALEPFRFIDIRKENGARTDNIIYQLREDESCKWLFIAIGKNPGCFDVDEDAQNLRFTLDGEYALTVYDTQTGKTFPLKAEYANGKTIFKKMWYMGDSLLLKLEKGRSQAGESADVYVPTSQPLLFLDKVPVTLHEPNALLLDMAEFAFDGEPYLPMEELLRADNYCRDRLGIPRRKKHVTQPYLIPEEKPTHSISLRFTIDSEIDVEKPQLAGEDMADMEISLNGERVPTDYVGWYVDEDINTISLPPIKKGKNMLEIKSPIGERTNLEWFYLLGDFGVRVDGAVKTITKPVRELAFGSYVHQGLPFYTGNLTYHLEFEAEGDVKLRVPAYRGALIQATVDGKAAGPIIYSPYMLDIGELSPGKHRADLLLYGTRQNGFAQLHHEHGVYFYQSPDSWRSEGDLWRYDYQLKPAGIMKSPEIYG
jgi:hypothetical protein